MSLVNRAIADCLARSCDIMAVETAGVDLAAAIAEAAGRGGPVEERLLRRAAAEPVIAAIAG